jgi:2-polyprenyl-3-methyl-5-hydroxy-6-metoxy-1,4-benzoquinol methylase
MEREVERACWCGNRRLGPFSPSYRLCPECATVVSQAGLSPGIAQAFSPSEPVAEAQGPAWLEAVEQGKRETVRRARADLPERCLHWLRTLLAYRLPPASVFEVGCNHGGLVALLRWAGYDAVGLELSTWVADYGRRAFGAPITSGLIEEQALPPGSLDVIVLNDVLEHLTDPVATMRSCAALLRPDGFLLIQTPKYPEGLSYQDMVSGGVRFVEMMTEAMAPDHLNLFSERSMRLLMERAGLPAVQFQPILFDYDMYLVASRRPLGRHGDEAVDEALLAAPTGRLVLALIDKAREARLMFDNWQKAEAWLKRLRSLWVVRVPRAVLRGIRRLGA